jgi:hypothetical protein
MDYMYFYSTARCGLLRFFVSYDIACQWHLNIRTRMAKYQDATLTLDRRKVVTYLVPKFHLPAHIKACNLKYSFNLTRYVGQTDGEVPERGWANANPLARSTKEMGPGFWRDTLDDHFNDWNHKKIIALGKRTLGIFVHVLTIFCRLCDAQEGGEGCPRDGGDAMCSV